MKIDTLAEEASRIARRLRNAAEMMEAEFKETMPPVDRHMMEDYVTAIRGLADQLAQAAAQISWPQAQPRDTATLTPSHLLSVLHEAAVTLEGDQLALLALGASLAGGLRATADDAHALDQIRDHLHDAARVLVTTASIAAKGLPLASPLLAGDPPMVRMPAEAFARVMAHLYVVQEWLGASLPEGTPESDRVRASLKRSIEIMRTGREQIDEPPTPPTSITLQIDPPPAPNFSRYGQVAWASGSTTGDAGSGLLGIIRPKACVACGRDFRPHEMITWCGGCDQPFCESCLGEPGADGYRRCKGCSGQPAAPSAATVDCGSCGNPIEGTVRICAICGKPNHPACIWQDDPVNGILGVCCMPF